MSIYDCMRDVLEQELSDGMCTNLLYNVMDDMIDEAEEGHKFLLGEFDKSAKLKAVALDLYNELSVVQTEMSCSEDLWALALEYREYLDEMAERLREFGIEVDE